MRKRLKRGRKYQDIIIQDTFGNVIIMENKDKGCAKKLNDCLEQNHQNSKQNDRVATVREKSRENNFSRSGKRQGIL